MALPVLVDIFKEVVQKVSAKITPTLKVVKSEILAVNFEYGMPLEITKVLTSYNDTPQKYPLIALLQPFQETSGNATGIAESGDFRIIIAGFSQAEWLTPERYDKNFKPILYPILDELLTQLYLDNRFEIPDRDNISYTKKDWPFWDDGKDTNPFNDILDVIEINFRSLKINLTYC